MYALLSESVRTFPRILLVGRWGPIQMPGQQGHPQGAGKQQGQCALLCDPRMSKIEEVIVMLGVPSSNQCWWYLLHESIAFLSSLHPLSHAVPTTHHTTQHIAPHHTTIQHHTTTLDYQTHPTTIQHNKHSTAQRCVPWLRDLVPRSTLRCTVRMHFCRDMRWVSCSVLRVLSSRWTTKMKKNRVDRRCSTFNAGWNILIDAMHT